MDCSWHRGLAVHLQNHAGLSDCLQSFPSDPWHARILRPSLTVPGVVKKKKTLNRFRTGHFTDCWGIVRCISSSILHASLSHMLTARKWKLWDVCIVVTCIERS